MNTANSCVICQQPLGSKKLLLHGIKCLKFDIRGKLQSLLPQSDFEMLYNRDIFPEPRICNLCFVTIKQVPKGLTIIRELLGEPININIYKPHRKSWCFKPDISGQLDEGEMSSLHNRQDSLDKDGNISETVSNQHTLLNGGKPERSPINHSPSCGVLLEQTRTQSAQECNTSQYKHGLITLRKGSLNVEEAGIVQNYATTKLNKKDSSKHQDRNNSKLKCFNGNLRSNDETKISNFNDISNSIGGVYFTSLIPENSNISCEKKSEKIGSKSRLLRQKTQEPSQDLKEKSDTKAVNGSHLTHVCGVPGCGQDFPMLQLLEEHSLTHSENISLTSNSTTGGASFENSTSLQESHRVGRAGRYSCSYPGCNSVFTRRDKYELHLCSHSRESFLFCEKCGKQFGCQRYLDVHYKVHEKNERKELIPPQRTVTCDIPGCNKRFTSRVYMKRHILYFHRDKRPGSQGLYHSCDVEGCDKKFSLKSTLSRHNLLVHNQGDYKLHRKVVKYPCTQGGCLKVFNRKKLLEDHMVGEHGKMSRLLLPQKTKEQDVFEKLCLHCGIVLTSSSQLPQHENICHSLVNTTESASYPCQMKNCEASFRTFVERGEHVRSHAENPPFKCEVEDCKARFYLMKNLDNHLWHHCKKVSTCDVDGCSQIFDDQLQLAKHSQIHFDGKMKCPWRNCSSRFTAMGTLKQHFLAHSRCLKASFGADFCCLVCDRVFSNKYGLRNHQRTHIEEVSGKTKRPESAVYECEEPNCHVVFRQHKHFFDHFLGHYTQDQTSCDHCQQTFTNMMMKSKHGKVHNSGKYRCPWRNCDKTFASSFFHVKKHLYRHVMSMPEVSADRPHTCSHCDMAFRNRNNLIHHQAQHSEKPDYVCTVCGKRFHHNHLKRHMLTHRQEKPHECQHCGVRYGTVNGLKFHVLQAHNIGNWPFKCSFCGKGFISSTELRRHIPSHTKEKPFSCETCGVSFATQTGYKGHVRKHSGEKYICDVKGCGKVYKTPLSLRGHKAEHAGFSKACSFCRKVYTNPYGHKCKASRDAKANSNKTGSCIQVPVTVPPPASPPVSLTTLTAVQHTSAVLPSTDSQQITPNMLGMQGTTPHSQIFTNAVSSGSSLVQSLGSTPTHETHPTMLSQEVVHDGQHLTPGAVALDATRTTVNNDYLALNALVYWDGHHMT
ncbi:zinc finger protein 62 homolog [Physella acuta]|uniref:zinc finger protein 62 homolog n=1 Tax=Physella acuta TaxID=109671 RepID=UPI0027DE57CF|nr:zinc finger protein 62 homolog [Physella acuta]XP_059146274.1 zinc finger protein 62 homolog [Physella acuta]